MTQAKSHLRGGTLDEQNASMRLGSVQVHGAFFLIVIDGEGTNSLWVVASLGSWSMPMGNKPVSSTFYSLLLPLGLPSPFEAPILTSFDDEYCGIS